jgi:ubiquinol-cytochrome c reductase cytochrome b subunit
VLAFAVTQRLCLGLARRDRDEAEHGRETGRIVMSPDGGYHEIREPADRHHRMRRPISLVE